MPALINALGWRLLLSAAIWLIRAEREEAFQFTLWQLLAATTWLAVHFAAWRTAILMMLERMALHWQSPPQWYMITIVSADDTASKW